MKNKTLLSFYSLLIAGLVTQVASAQINVTAIQGGTVEWSATDSTLADTTGLYQPSTLKTRSSTTAGSEYSFKAWLQFDLTPVLAANGGAGNLTGATLTMYNQNDTGRHFNVSGLADNAGLENWSSAILAWNNAPGNDTSGLSGLNAYNWSDVYGGTYLYSMNGGGVAAYTTAHSQNAYYVSPDISAFLQTDTDGKVTFMIDGYNNMGWWNAPSAAWSSQSIADGEISPYLTLTFAPVPEPTTLALAALGLGGLFLARRRRS